MNQQVAVYDPRQQAPAQVFTMSEMERIALAIAKGRLFGSDDPNAVLTLCMLAQAEGQHPAVVFRDYHIISGKPAKKAEAMQRDFLAAGGKIEWHKLDDEECSATFSHPQGGSATISWDKARVAQAELGANKMHKKYPRQMLRSRVISEGVRTVFPMATSGLYESGEVQDMTPEPRADTPPTPQPQRARDLKAEQPQVEVQEPDYDGTVLATLEAIAKPGQADALAAAWQEIGKDARKALADELPRLKSLCEPLPEPDERQVEPDTNVNDVAQAAADKIIAEIEAPECNAEMDVKAVLSRREADIAALPDDQQMRVEIAVSRRRAAIEAEREAAQVTA